MISDNDFLLQSNFHFIKSINSGQSICCLLFYDAIFIILGLLGSMGRILLPLGSVYLFIANFFVTQNKGRARELAVPL